MMEKPLVSICCITYNHAPFIRQTLDGMLMQEGVDYEILIHDDCSTDGTTEIVKEYAAKYPDKIFPIYEEENQYSKGVWVDGFNYKRARGKYIAYCEGDDYWTDPLKLQKQVDFMEANPEYSVCFTRNDFKDNFNEGSTIRKYEIKPAVEYATDLNLSDHLNGTMGVLPLTMVFRRDKFDYEWHNHYTQYCDTMELYHLMKNGKGVVLNFSSAVYNSHAGGVSSSNTDVRRSWENVRDAWEMYDYIGDEDTKQFYQKSLMWRLDVCERNAMRKQYWELYQYAFSKTPKIAFQMLLTRLKRKIKHFVK